MGKKRKLFRIAVSVMGLLCLLRQLSKTPFRISFWEVCKTVLILNPFSLLILFLAPMVLSAWLLFSQKDSAKTCTDEKGFASQLASEKSEFDSYGKWFYFPAKLALCFIPFSILQPSISNSKSAVTSRLGAFPILFAALLATIISAIDFALIKNKVATREKKKLSADLRFRVELVKMSRFVSQPLITILVGIFLLPGGWTNLVIGWLFCTCLGILLGGFTKALVKARAMSYEVSE